MPKFIIMVVSREMNSTDENTKKMSAATKKAGKECGFKLASRVKRDVKKAFGGEFLSLLFIAEVVDESLLKKFSSILEGQGYSVKHWPESQKSVFEKFTE